ncbi:hypothetical protein CRG98_029123 [Punica granatum]|uniref:valine--tRNA ligase n=1 Tax=Punica granatum TaxID=22663 RepID=A0A2I0J2L4_PUNGR|nr:hypothetical protein CRG98_029123 [Punica granatum]
MPFSCKWILSLLNRAIVKTVASLNSYEFSDATKAVYSWWQQLSEVFIVAIKPYYVDKDTFVPERTAAQFVLWLCLDYGLRLLHPFMPFIIEELWQRLPSLEGVERKESIMTSDYPSPVECWTNERVEQEMDLVLSVVKGLKSFSSANLTKKNNECKQEKVRHVMSVHGYKEKAPIWIQEESARKLSGFRKRVLENLLRLYGNSSVFRRNSPE